MWQKHLSQPLVNVCPGVNKLPLFAHLPVGTRTIKSNSLSIKSLFNFYQATHEGLCSVDVSKVNIQGMQLSHSALYILLLFCFTFTGINFTTVYQSAALHSLGAGTYVGDVQAIGCHLLDTV